MFPFLELIPRFIGWNFNGKSSQISLEFGVASLEIYWNMFTSWSIRGIQAEAFETIGDMGKILMFWGWKSSAVGKSDVKSGVEAFGTSTR